MPGPSTDSHWQNLSKQRRAAVYRAIGRAAKTARAYGEPEVADDIRIVIDLLRGHATAKAASKKSAARKRKPAAAKRARKSR